MENQLNNTNQNVPSSKPKKSNVLNELKTLQVQTKSFKPSELYVPVLSLVILLLLTIFVYIPMISQALKYKAEQKQVKDKITQLNKLQKDMSAVDLAQLQSDLADVRAVIPFSLQVSDFILNVDQLATKQNLKFKDILAGDIQIRSANEKRSSDNIVKGVSGPLKYNGGLENITSFLDGLQNASPYLITPDEITLKKNAENATWDVTVAITGYYINKAALTQPNIYNTYTPYSQYSGLLNVFRDKAEKITNK